MPGLEQVCIACGKGHEPVMAVEIEAHNRLRADPGALLAIKGVCIGRVDGAKRLDMISQHISHKTLRGPENGFSGLQRRMASCLNSSTMPTMFV